MATELVQLTGVLRYLHDPGHPGGGVMGGGRVGRERRQQQHCVDVSVNTDITWNV